jgi:hypothetical protein
MNLVLRVVRFVVPDTTSRARAKNGDKMFLSLIYYRLCEICQTSPFTIYVLFHSFNTKMQNRDSEKYVYNLGMRSTAKAKPRDTTVSPIDRLEQMTQRRSPPKRSSPKIPESADPEAVLDMIDQRIGHLLVRSGDIESKIEKLESEALPILRDDSTPTQSKPAPIRPTRDSAPPAEGADLTDLVRAVLAMQAAVQEIREEQKRTSQQINEIHLRLKQRHARE